MSKLKQDGAEDSPGAAGPCRHKPEPERCLTCILDSSDYFSGLTIKAKTALQRGLKRKHFARKEMLYSDGKKSSHLYILLTGEIKVYKSLSDGRQQIHKIASIPGDLIACEDLFLDTYSSTAEAINEASVCYLEKNYLQEVSNSHREIPDAMMRAMARHLNSYIRHIANLGNKNALERVASYLVFLYETHRKRNLRLDMLAESLTRVELGDMLGITQRTLIRSLKSLEEKKLISLARDGFIIHEMKSLLHIAESG
jgi:CRP/FNR family transcriptional regulator